MPETIIDLGRKVKEKHPEYSDMSDAEVGTKVKAKYPQEYADFMDVSAAPRPPSGVGDPTKPGYVMGEVASDIKRHAGQAWEGVTSLIPDAIRQGLAVGKDVVTGQGGAVPTDDILVRLAKSPTVQSMAKSAPQLARPGLTMLQNTVAAGQPALMQQATPEQTDEAAKFGGQTMAAMALGEGAKLVRPGVSSVGAGLSENVDASKAAISDRVTRSMIRPKEGSFDFGADPVKAAESIPRANTLKGYSNNVNAAVAEQESLLQKAIKLRHETASSVGANNTFDVAPSITDSYEAMAKDAESLNKPAMAKNLRELGKRQIEELKARNGNTTWLDPDQILTEKRLIRDKVKFKTNEAEQMTTNEALANHYRALDGALDELVPEAKEINARYSGLIELKDLVEHQIHVQGNAPILAKGNFFQSFIKAMPETAAKSRIIEMMNKGKEAMGTRLGGQPNVFYPKTGAPDYLANPSGVGTPGLTTNQPIPVGPVNWLMTPSGVGGHGLGEMPPAPVGAPNWMLTPSGVGTHGLGEMTVPDVGAPDYLSGKQRVPDTRLVSKKDAPSKAKIQQGLKKK